MAIDRSIPPVSMHTVWLAANTASGHDSSRMERIPFAVSRLWSRDAVIA